MPDQPEPSPRRSLLISIDGRSIGLVLITVGAVWLLFKLWTVLVLAVVALVVVGTLKPAVEWLERRGIGRGFALILLFLWMMVGFAGIILLTIPPLVSELADVLQHAPQVQARAVHWLNQYALTRSFADSLRGSKSSELFATARDYLLAYSTDVVGVLGYGVTTMFLAFYLLADGKRTQGALYAVVPRGYHLRLSRILLNLETIVGGYVRGQAITSVAIAVFTFALLSICGVPNALALAMLAGFADVIPFVGGFIATVPAVLFALSRGSTIAIVVGVTLAVYQEFESRILVPRIYGRALRMPPAAVLLALLIGGTLLGIIGALLALPIAAGLQMIGRELRLELPGEDTDHTELRARDQRAEETYERLAAGVPAEEAGVIATEIAKEIRADDAAAAGDEVAAATLPVTSGEAKDAG